MLFAGNRYIPFHAVSYARIGGEGRIEVHLVDGDLVKVAAPEFEREWAKANSQLLPAPPGYDAVSRIEADGQIHLLTTPIIAFRVDEAGTVSPIVLDPAEANRFEAIRYPDGRVFAADGGRYEDLERWAKSASRRGI